MSTGTNEITRSGRVRKKSAKLMEMEESETSEKQVDKKPTSSTTPKRTPKTKPVKLKMSIGGTPVCEVVEDFPIVECADLYVEEPQLEIVSDDPPPLPPITMKLNASRGTSQLGSSTLKSLEVVSEKRPSSRSDCESDTPKSSGRKRKITATTEEDIPQDIPLQVHAGKPSSKKSKKASGDGKSRKLAITGYTLWTKENRPKIQLENPEMDFPAVSRRLGEIWQLLSNNEKLHWKIKAQKLVGKMSSPGVVAAEQPPPTIASPPARLAGIKKASPAPAFVEAETPTSIENKMKNIPMAVATHLRVLGESMSSIGHKLSQQDSNDLPGPLSDLLDSTLCALNCLMFLTCVDPKLNGCPISTHLRAMDNIAYVMPGV